MYIRHLFKSCSTRPVVNLKLYLPGSNSILEQDGHSGVTSLRLSTSNLTANCIQPTYTPPQTYTSPQTFPSPGQLLDNESVKLARFQKVCSNLLRSDALYRLDVATVISDTMKEIWPDENTSPYLISLKLRALYNWGLDQTAVLRHSQLFVLDLQEIVCRGHLHYANAQKQITSDIFVDLLASRLGVEVSELDKRISRFPIKFSRSLVKFEDFISKIVLLSDVYGLDTIAKRSRVLLVNKARIEKRLRVIENLSVKISWLCETGTKFDKHLAKIRVENHEKSDFQVLEIAFRLGELERLDLLTPKIKLLLHYGFSECDIIEKPQLLKPSLQGLKDRLTLLRDKRILVETILKHSRILQMKTEKLAFGLRRIRPRARNLGALNYARISAGYVNDIDLDTAPDRLATIAETFSITQREAESLFQNIRLSTLNRKLDLFKTIGISKSKVLSHPYLMRLGMRKLRNIVKSLDQEDSTKDNLEHFFALCSEPIIPRRRKRKFITEMLLCSRRDFSLFWSDLCIALCREEHELRETVVFLLTSGFSLEDIQCCPFALNYNWKVLEEILKKSPVVQDLNDSGVKLNTLVYLAEEAERVPPCAFLISESEDVTIEEEEYNNIMDDCDAENVSEDCS